VRGGPYRASLARRALHQHRLAGDLAVGVVGEARNRRTGGRTAIAVGVGDGGLRDAELVALGVIGGGDGAIAARGDRRDHRVHLLQRERLPGRPVGQRGSVDGIGVARYRNLIAVGIVPVAGDVAVGIDAVGQPTVQVIDSVAAVAVGVGADHRLAKCVVDGAGGERAAGGGQRRGIGVEGARVGQDRPDQVVGRVVAVADSTRLRRAVGVDFGGSVAVVVVLVIGLGTLRHDARAGEDKGRRGAGLPDQIASAVVLVGPGLAVAVGVGGLQATRIVGVRGKRLA